jgi:hypothetical protein
VAVKVLRHHINDEHAGSKLDKVNSFEISLTFEAHNGDSGCVESFEYGEKLAITPMFYHFMGRLPTLDSTLPWFVRG